jgi:predicted nucleic acid-binding protein
VSIVLDASVALKWVFEERGTDAALALQSEPLVAPAIWLAEAGNALWRRMRIGEITAEQAYARLSELRASPVATLAIEPFIDKALQLAIELDHPIYDCVYLAVALDQDTHVVSDDRRFVAAAARSEFTGRVRLLGDESPPTRRRRRRGGPSR